MTHELQHFIQHSIQFVHLMQRFAALSVIGYAIHQYTCTSNIFLYDMGCGRIIRKEISHYVRSTLPDPLASKAQKPYYKFSYKQLTLFPSVNVKHMFLSPVSFAKLLSN